MATCQNCGHEILEGVVFCGSCGSAVTPPPIPIDPAGNKSTSHNRNLLVAVIAGVVIVVGVVVGIVIATSGRPSPATMVNGYINDLNSGNFRGACGYVLPYSQRSACLSLASSTSGVHITSTHRVLKVVVDGNRAIVGIIGYGCASGQCSSTGSNSDPIPGLSKGFNAAFSEAVAAASSSSSSSSGAVPCVFQNGHWYLYLPKS